MNPNPPEQIPDEALVPLGDYRKLQSLCARAADALDCHNLDHLQDDLVAELRKAAE